MDTYHDSDVEMTGEEESIASSEPMEEEVSNEGSESFKNLFQKMMNGMGIMRMMSWMRSTGDESLTKLAVYFHNWHMFCKYMNNIAC